jgi:hypothetical protein
MPWYQGSSLVTVVEVDADFPQRAVLKIRGGATVVLDGTAGASHYIDGSQAASGWDLELEHEFEGEWMPNIRAVVGRWETVNGVPSQLIRSKDRDRLSDRRGRNLVLRIDRTTAGPDPEPVVAETVQTAARITTSGAMQTGSRSTNELTDRRMTTSQTDQPSSTGSRTAGMSGTASSSGGERL